MKINLKISRNFNADSLIDYGFSKVYDLNYPEGYYYYRSHAEVAKITVAKSDITGSWYLHTWLYNKKGKANKYCIDWRQFMFIQDLLQAHAVVNITYKPEPDYGIEDTVKCKKKRFSECDCDDYKIYRHKTRKDKNQIWECPHGLCPFCKSAGVNCGCDFASWR